MKKKIIATIIVVLTLCFALMVPCVADTMSGENYVGGHFYTGDYAVLQWQDMYNGSGPLIQDAERIQAVIYFDEQVLYSALEACSDADEDIFIQFDFYLINGDSGRFKLQMYSTMEYFVEVTFGSHTDYYYDGDWETESMLIAPADIVNWNTYSNVDDLSFVAKIVDKLFVRPFNSEEYADGYQAGYAEGYTRGDTVGYQRGYQEGLDYAYEHMQGGTFSDLVSAPLDGMVKVLQGLLNFEILGVNILGFVTSLFTIAIVYIIMKKVLK